MYYILIIFRNPLCACKELPEIDLWKWKDNGTQTQQAGNNVMSLLSQQPSTSGGNNGLALLSILL